MLLFHGTFIPSPLPTNHSSKQPFTIRNPLLVLLSKSESKSKPKFKSTISASSSASPLVPLSITDEELASRGFVLHRSAETLNLDELNTIFVRVGFPRRDPAKIEVALENTASLLWLEHAKSRRPVAFARATGDGVFNAVIWDVVVDPSYQGFGLGRAVMERLLAELVERGVSNIALYAEPKVLGFYRPLGFAADPDGIRGMVYSRKKSSQPNKRRPPPS